MKTLLITLLILTSFSCQQLPRSSPEQKEEKLPEMSLYHLPSKWTTHNNEEIALVELKSKVLVVVMIYTSCKAACPRLVADMQNIESQIDPKVKKNLKMVFVSIDPTTDTPEHLKAFAIANKMDHDPWLFLRGSESNTREFAAVLAVKYKKITPLDFSHSNIISVFNPEGVLVHQQEGLGVNNQETITTIKEQLDKLP
ncbi:MAG: SCO family protein [Flavobacteriaceae bacterium]|jgi:protein SCO1/2